jgi:hypothetical protein
MNEMDLLARLRDEVPSGQVPAEAARRLTAAIAAAPSGCAPPIVPAVRRGGLLAGQPRWRLAVAGIVAAAVAAGSTAIALTTTSGSMQPARLTATELAYRAAAAAARAPEVRPGQWVFRELYSPGATPFQPGGMSPLWATADDRLNAFYVHHRLVVGPWSAWQPIACLAGHGQSAHAAPCAAGHQRYIKVPVSYPYVRYAQLGSLPASPRRLIAVLAARNPHGYVVSDLREGMRVIIFGFNTTSERFRAFNVICSLFASYVMPPRLTAELYRALGDIPGIEVNPHAVDVSGRHGIAFVLRSRQNPRNSEAIILNPRTYQFMAFGSRQQGTAVLHQAVVSGPGIRPGRG